VAYDTGNCQDSAAGAPITTKGVVKVKLTLNTLSAMSHERS